MSEGHEMKTLLNPSASSGQARFGSFFKHYGFIVKFLEDISREQVVLFFFAILLICNSFYKVTKYGAEKATEGLVQHRFCKRAG